MKWPIVFEVKPLSERQFVIISIIFVIVGMFLMARENPSLWEVELFKTLLTAFAITGFLNMVVAFHFSANKTDESKTENTARAFEAITAAATAAGRPEQLREAAAHAAEEVVDAAVVAADKVTEEAELAQIDLERNR